MPLLNRSINHASEGAVAMERVKVEEPLSEFQESNLSSDNKEVIEGKWNDDQNLKFVIFVNYYQDIFSSRHKRKTSKIFKTFEEYLQDRTAAQCRSHYQKIIQKFKTVAKVKKHFESHYGRQSYRKQYQNFKEKWEETHPPINIKDPQIRQFKQISIQTDPADQTLKEVKCSQCACSMQPGPIFSPQPPFQGNQYNSYLYWNQMNHLAQMNMNYYCMFPPRSEQTIIFSDQ